METHEPMLLIPIKEYDELKALKQQIDDIINVDFIKFRYTYLGEKNFMFIRKTDRDEFLTTLKNDIENQKKILEKEFIVLTEIRLKWWYRLFSKFSKL